MFNIEAVKLARLWRQAKQAQAAARLGSGG